MTEAASEPEHGSMTQMWQQMNHGNSQASNDLYARLLPRMYAIARKSIGPVAKRGIEADDVVQSAMISFWNYSQAGKLADDLNRNDLWALISTFTTRKLKKHLRRENTLKRGSGNVIGENALQGKDGEAQRLDQLVQKMPTDDFDEAIEEMLALLPEDLTRIALLKLGGHSSDDISIELDCTKRTVQRKINLIKELWDGLK
jgi:RNA polymerase sigma factor (sigma-70 family)